MSDLISREALQGEILRVTLENPDSSHNYAVAVANAISNAPAADAVEVVHAKWGKMHYDAEFDEYTRPCSNCGYYSLEYVKLYCPNCGARMDGE